MHQAAKEREQELKAELAEARGAIGVAKEKASSLEERIQRLNADLELASHQRNDAESELVSLKVPSLPLDRYEGAAF